MGPPSTLMWWPNESIEAQQNVYATVSKVMNNRRVATCTKCVMAQVKAAIAMDKWATINVKL